MKKKQLMMNSLDCPICITAYCCKKEDKMPYSLTCGHTFCITCIRKFPANSCPTCRKAFVMSDIKKNYQLMAVIEERQFEHKLCENEKEEIVCLKCLEVTCQTCFKCLHNSHPPLLVNSKVYQRLENTKHIKDLLFSINDSTSSISLQLHIQNTINYLENLKKQIGSSREPISKKSLQQSYVDHLIDGTDYSKMSKGILTFSKIHPIVSPLFEIDTLIVGDEANESQEAKPQEKKHAPSPSPAFNRAHAKEYLGKR